MDAERRHAATALGRAVLLAVWTLLLVSSTGVLSPAPVSALLFVVLGAFALALATFDLEELRPRAAGSLLWDTTARNAWLTGALGSIVFFVRAFYDSSASIAGVARTMALSVLPSVYGLVLAAACLVAAARRREAGATAIPDSDRESAWDGWLGRFLFALLLAWSAGQPYAVVASSRFTPWGFLLDGPALLVVLGGALAVFLAAGNRSRGRMGVPALAASGTLGSLIGLFQALLGFAGQSIARVASGLSFTITACFVTLAAMALLADPAEDRRARRGEPPSALSRFAWALFPVVTILFLVATFALVVTPMTMKV